MSTATVYTGESTIFAFIHLKLHFMQDSNALCCNRYYCSFPASASLCGFNGYYRIFVVIDSSSLSTLYIVLVLARLVYDALHCILTDTLTYSRTHTRTQSDIHAHIVIRNLRLFAPHCRMGVCVR